MKDISGSLDNRTLMSENRNPKIELLFSKKTKLNLINFFNS